jgi:hypothetical protein
MAIPRWQKIVLMVAVSWPLVFAGLGYLVVGTLTDGFATQSSFDRWAPWVVGVLLFTLLDAALTWIVLLVITQSTRLPIPRGERTPWFLVLFFGAFIGAAVFFWARVWPDPLDASADAAQGGPLQADADSLTAEAHSPHP